MPRGAPAPVTRAVRWAGKGWIVVVSRVMSGSPFVRCAGTAAARKVSADDEVEDEQQGDRGCPHDGGHAAVRLQGRSEERRVGKEWAGRGARGYGEAYSSA